MRDLVCLSAWFIDCCSIAVEDTIDWVVDLCGGKAIQWKVISLKNKNGGKHVHAV